MHTIICIIKDQTYFCMRSQLLTTMKKSDIPAFYDKIALKISKRKRRRNKFYHKSLDKYFKLIIPEGSSVLELGSGNGDLLNAVKPKPGLGIDVSEEMTKLAKERYPSLQFECGDSEELNINQKFDYIILSDLVSILWDVQKVFQEIKKVSHSKTKIILSYYTPSWEYFIRILEFFRLKQKQPIHNWLSVSDIKNLAKLEDFEIVKNDRKILLPIYIPIINLIVNKFISNLPLINRLNLVNLVTLRPNQVSNEEHSVTIVVPARNEKGNIENAILQTPKFGSWQEFIFIEGNSSDGTYEEMLRVKEKYSDMKVQVFKQSGKGKGNAVREAFDKATGDILMILDADLTTPPEEMPKFYTALATNKGEFINGCRLVYSMEKQAMRFLNLLGNKFFGHFFSFLLGQRLKDTLCGTKVLFKTDYIKIQENRSYFGDFDPFGDFDLLFGAAKLNLKITEVIVRYKDRVYGSTQISRFKHGWLLIKMSLFAAIKLKFK